MLLSRIPYVGRFMEIERIYINTLFVEHLHPYVEYGYGFTNRFFSMGIFWPHEMLILKDLDADSDLSCLEIGKN